MADKAKLLTLTKNYGYVVQIFPSLIAAKKLADTTYCGSPFVFMLEDISIYPKVKRCFYVLCRLHKNLIFNYVLSCHDLQFGQITDTI